MSLVIIHPDGSVEPAIRKLNEEEMSYYTQAMAKATTLLPAYRDALALMRPFKDATAGTCYIDRHSRVGLSPWFFTLDVFQQASALLHECSHVLHDCFVRGETMGADPYLNNIASDLEINSGLSTVRKVDLSFAIHPAREPYEFETFLSQEQYFHLLKENGFKAPESKPDPNCPQHGDKSEDESSQNGSQEKQDQNDGDGDRSPSDSGDPTTGENGDSGGGDGDGSEQNDGSSDSSGDCTCGTGQQGEGSGSGNSSGDGSGDAKNTKSCDEVTEEREGAADDAGVERASDSEQSIAKKNTMANMAEEAKNARAAGNGTLADFLERSLNHMQPPKVNWRSIFRRVVSRIDQAVVRGRSEYSYRRSSRRITDSQFIFPGMIKYQPKIMIGVDTSGSMRTEDHLKTAYEIEGIIKAASSARDNIQIFSVDTKVQNIKPVSSVSKLDLRGGGGTAMEVAWEYVNSLSAKEKPSIFCLATDGGTAWEPIQEEVIKGSKYYKSIILVTTSGGYASVLPSLKDHATVIDISEE